jgi:hypothetical protein
MRFHWLAHIKRIALAFGIAWDRRAAGFMF